MTGTRDPLAQLLPRLVDGRGVDALSWSDASSSAPGAVAAVHVSATGTALRVAGRSVPVDPGALPLATNGVTGLSVVGLHLCTDAEAVFAELRRVLRPAGTLVVVVPSASVRSIAELRVAGLLRRVRHRGGVLDGTGWLLAAADFSVIGDDRVRFTVDGTYAEELVDAGIWARLPPEGLPLPPTMTVALRRLVARR